MKKVLVTGAAGFVGKNLLSIIADEGIIDKLIFVDKHPPTPYLINKIESSGIKFKVFTSSRLPLDRESKDVDSVICLAGATSVDAALLEPKRAIDENMALAADLAEWARCINPLVKIIYMSSDEVLGESLAPLGEDTPLNPTQPYAASKAAAEIVLHNYRDVYKLNIVTVRSCNLVGAFQKKPKLIPTAVEALLENRPVLIQGDGNQLREWMAVEDLCKAIILLLQKDVVPQVYQATSGVKISVNSVVKIIAEKLGVDLKTIRAPDRLVQDRSYAMQSDRLNSLGWYPVSIPQDAIGRAASLLAEQINENSAIQSNQILV